MNNYKPAFILIAASHIPPGYTLYSLDRIDRRGGGVAIYVAHAANNIAIMPKVDDEYYRHDVERLWQDIRFGELDFLLACVCRPPSNCLFESDD